LTSNAFQLHPKKARVIYNPIELPDAEEVVPGFPQNARVIVYTGTVSRRKGAYSVARACRGLLQNNNDLHLVFVGTIDEESDGPISEKLVALLDPDVRSRVHFTGRISRKGVLYILRRSILGVFPSSLEAHPLAACEAMMAGLPVVMLDSGPSRELGKDGATMLLARPNDIEHLESQLEVLVSNDEAGKSIGEAGRRFVQARFATEACCSAMEEFYREIISDWKAAGH
jgi:glycosyltransferase involved in cell wall biosynthesis